jgi:hypothetical protein
MINNLIDNDDTEPAQKAPTPAPTPTPTPAQPRRKNVRGNGRE